MPTPSFYDSPPHEDKRLQPSDKCTQTVHQLTSKLIVCNSIKLCSVGTQTCKTSEGRLLRKKLRRLTALKRVSERKQTNLKTLNRKLVRRIDILSKERSPSKDLNLAALPQSVATFVQEQVSNQAKDKRGAQWSASTIAIAQCILYKSPACYRKLQTFFSLPSTSTLFRRAPYSAKEVSNSVSTFS